MWEGVRGCWVSNQPFTDKQAQRGEMRRYIRLMARDELGGGGQTGDLRIRERAARREKGEREGEMKEVGEIQGKVDVRTSGCS